MIDKTLHCRGGERHRCAGCSQKSTVSATAPTATPESQLTRTDHKVINMPGMGIQALRACAVTAVVLAHITPSIVAKDEPRSGATTIGKAAQSLVDHAFRDRVMDPDLFKTLGEWDLEAILPLFDSPHRQSIGVYLARLREFDRRFGKWDSSVPAYGTFLSLAGLDPLTRSNGPPTSRSVTKQLQTADRAVFTVEYELPGVRHSYRRNVTVTVAKKMTGWVVTSIEYESGALPHLGRNQTFQAMLQLLTLQLEKSIAWAKQHPDKLSTPEELLQEIPR